MSTKDIKIDYSCEDHLDTVAPPTTTATTEKEETTTDTLTSELTTSSKSMNCSGIPWSPPQAGKQCMGHDHPVNNR